MDTKRVAVRGKEEVYAVRTLKRGKTDLKQKSLVSYLSGEDDLGKEDLFVNITLYRVPGDLVREFALKFVYKYPEE